MYNHKPRDFYDTRYHSSNYQPEVPPGNLTHSGKQTTQYQPSMPPPSINHYGSSLNGSYQNGTPPNSAYAGTNYYNKPQHTPISYQTATPSRYGPGYSSTYDQSYQGYDGYTPAPNGPRDYVDNSPPPYYGGCYSESSRSVTDIEPVPPYDYQSRYPNRPKSEKPPRNENYPMPTDGSSRYHTPMHSRWEPVDPAVKHMDSIFNKVDDYIAIRLKTMNDEMSQYQSCPPGPSTANVISKEPSCSQRETYKQGYDSPMFKSPNPRNESPYKYSKYFPEVLAKKRNFCAEDFFPQPSKKRKFSTENLLPQLSRKQKSEQKQQGKKSSAHPPKNKQPKKSSTPIPKKNGNVAGGSNTLIYNEKPTNTEQKETQGKSKPGKKEKPKGGKMKKSKKKQIVLKKRQKRAAKDRAPMERNLDKFTSLRAVRILNDLIPQIMARFPDQKDSKHTMLADMKKIMVMTNYMAKDRPAAHVLAESTSTG